jgi:hypothetical protein
MKIHFGFRTSGEAYDASQTQEEISDGDILVVDNGRVAILVAAWPTQLSDEPKGGEFHRLQVAESWEHLDRGRYAESAKVARMIRKQSSW